MARRVQDCNVTIVGLGLMGGSLAGALRGKCRTVVGVARRSEAVERALALGLVDRATTDVADGVRSADMVILATPVRIILRQMAELAPLLPEGCLLMDLGSTKARSSPRWKTCPGTCNPWVATPCVAKKYRASRLPIPPCTGELPLS